MKKNLKKVFSFLLSFCMVVQYLPMAVFAAESEEIVELESAAEVFVPDIEYPENDELFQIFVEEKLYDYEIATFGTRARETLNDAEKALYDALKTRIEEVALNGGSTVFVLNEVPGLKTSWTREELGISGYINLDVHNGLVSDAFYAQLNWRNAITALLDDCPFDLYWYDKTQGVAFGYRMRSNGLAAEIFDIRLTFVVAGDYKSEENVVTSNVSKVSVARETAQFVVKSNESKTSIGKLTAYKEYICDAVSYDYAAANNSDTPYGDPWQLISVFDGDPSTKVVCEGYAKAFQYLCDLSGLDCICVSGSMSSGYVKNDHMWNVVTLNGKNYLVDVTNCDSGTAGEPDLLFLKGAAYNNGCYAFPCLGQTVKYYCEDLSLATDIPEDEVVHVHNTDGEVTYECVDETNHVKFVACKDCPEDYIAESVEAHSTTAAEDKAATEKEPAYCSVCDSSYGEPLPHVHNTDGEVTYECIDETGHVKFAACKDCPEDYVTESVEAHSTTAAEDKAATEKEPAYCSVCNSSYGEPLPHVHNTDGEVIYECIDETGHVKLVACKDCPEDYVTESEEAHSTTAAEDKAATEKEPAYCSVCDSSYGEPLPHVHNTDGEVTYECVDALSHVKFVACKDCPENYVTESIETHSTTAAEDKAVTDQEPAYCSVCDSSYGSALPGGTALDCHGDIYYAVEDSNIIVDNSIPCKIGYFDGEKFVVLEAVANADGTHSFALPEGANEIILIGKGNLDADKNSGVINSADKLLLARSLLLENHPAYQPLDQVQKFAADLNNDGIINSADKLLLARSLLLEGHPAFKKLDW